MRRLRLIRGHLGPFWRHASNRRANWALVTAVLMNALTILAVLERDPPWVWLLLFLSQMAFLAAGVGLAAGAYRRSLSHPQIYTRDDIKGRWW